MEHLVTLQLSNATMWPWSRLLNAWKSPQGCSNPSLNLEALLTVSLAQPSFFSRDIVTSSRGFCPLFSENRRTVMSESPLASANATRFFSCGRFWRWSGLWKGVSVLEPGWREMQGRRGLGEDTQSRWLMFGDPLHLKPTVMSTDLTETGGPNLDNTLEVQKYDKWGFFHFIISFYRVPTLYDQWIYAFSDVCNVCTHKQWVLAEEVWGLVEMLTTEIPVTCH